MATSTQSSSTSYAAENLALDPHPKAGLVALVGISVAAIVLGAAVVVP
jgi:hypothetical protein